MRIPGLAAVPSPPPGVEVFAKTARRLEYKFIVPKSHAGELRRVLQPWVRLDKHSEKRPGHRYTVRSIYYDNRRFACYEEKVEGFPLKKKFRIRGYNEPEADAPLFLEIKRKYDDYIDKSRARFSWRDIDRIFNGYGPSRPNPVFRPGTADADAAARFLYNYYRRRLLPAVLVTYEREAYQGRFDPTLRITFDSNVRTRLFPRLETLYDDRATRFLMPGHFVLEVKFHRGLPRWVSSILTDFDLTRLACSKYALGIDCWRVEKKLLRGVGHTVEFPEDRAPLERRRQETWLDGVLLAATEKPEGDSTKEG
jgi:hypothetical protein